MHPAIVSNYPSPETFEEIQFFNGKNYYKGNFILLSHGSFILKTVLHRFGLVHELFSRPQEFHLEIPF